MPVTRHADVIIVGAGLSGLQCAVSPREAGVSVLVLEARDRVGGKTWSRDFSSGVVDMGAAWINDTNQSSMYALAKRFDLETITQNTNGDIVMQDIDDSVHSFPYGGIPAQEVEVGGVEDMVRIRDLFEETCQKIDLRDLFGGKDAELWKFYDTISMKGFVEHHKGKELAMCTVSIWTRAMLGLEPEEVSALFFLSYCKGGGGLMSMRSDQRGGGQFLRIAKGTQSFSHSLASLLPADSIILNSPVAGIDTSDSVYAVTTTSGKQYTSSRVVISVSTNLYSTIKFVTPLPLAKQMLSEGTIHGHTSKVFLSYEIPWWRHSGSCGLTQSTKGLVAVTRDTSNDKLSHYSLLCFLVGNPGRSWAKLSASERREAVTKHIREVFTPLIKDVPEPSGYTEQIWSNEEWSAGCPCPAMPPRLMTEVGHALREPVGKIHFVGTETAFEWKGYMEGAVRSGVRGADEVLAALSRSKI